ncbi:MAG: flavin-containing monooxygenase [Gemmataceae bacterium]
MATEYFDVLIVGAGLSGIGMAYHLQDKCPKKTYAVLEGRDVLGGTWDLFRYPGIRSDSDMHTLGYTFKPWLEAKAIADGPSILKYVQDTARENGIDKHIRYGHFVKKASWSSEDASWTVQVELKETGETVTFQCNMLLMCTGYYSYKGGHTPEFPGRESFQGQLVHPQEWPEDLDHKGKKVIVIGSGATAMTLVPAIAEDVEHVVMLQRSPTYVVALPSEDKVANFLRRFLPQKIAYALTRWKNVSLQQYFYRRMREHPEAAKKRLIEMVREQLGEDYDVETHFTPTYNPWDQRLCVVPDGDLFQAIKSGKASMATGHIDTFTEKGIRLQSGEILEADIIVTATGLTLVTLGNVEFYVDDAPVDFSDTFTYKGMMYSDVPNMVYTFGYINASWTLRADLTAEYICRLINHMDKGGFHQCTPRLREEDRGMSPRPFLDYFTPGYVQRSIHRFPKQGDREPWLNPQNYFQDKKMFRKSPVDDGVMVFTKRAKKPSDFPQPVESVG